LASDRVHEGATLQAGERSRTDLFADLEVVAQHHATTRTPQGLVGGGGYDMGVGQGARMHATSDQSGKVCHVDHEVSAHLIRDPAEAFEVQDPGVGGAAGDDHLRLMLVRQALDLIEVDQAILAAHSVLYGIEPLAGDIGSGPVSQVPPGGKREAEEGVAGFQQCQHHALIGLSSGVRLYIHEAAAKELLCPRNRKFLDDIDGLAAAVVTAAGIAFRILVGQDRALSFQYGAREDVLAGDQLDLVLLTPKLRCDTIGQFGIAFAKARGEEGGDRGSWAHSALVLVVLSFDLEARYQGAERVRNHCSTSPHAADDGRLRTPFQERLPSTPWRLPLR